MSSLFGGMCSIIMLPYDIVYTDIALVLVFNKFMHTGTCNYFIFILYNFLFVIVFVHSFL